MTIVNLGKTIPDNVNEFFRKTNKKPLESDVDCVEWAFGDGNTTKTTTGGLGLFILQSFIDLNKGKIQIVSGRAFVEYEQGKFSKDLLEKQFPGTIINVEFNANDKNSYCLKNESTQDLL